MTGALWVVGSTNVDLVVRTDSLPAAGETVTGGTFSTSGGGKGANQAVAAARAGARVYLTGAVGADADGTEALESLRAEGIDVSTCAQLPDVRTGVALIVVDERGDNQIAVAPGANSRLDPESVRRAHDALAEPPAVCLLGFEIPVDAVLAAAECAVAAGALVVVNPAPARPLPPELLRCHPLLTPNAGEAQRLTGEPDPERAARVLNELSGAPVVVTLGPRGVLLFDGETAELLPAVAVPVVDATGAGDVFSGTLAARLAIGDALRAAVTAAARAAEASVGRPGAR